MHLRQGAGEPGAQLDGLGDLAVGLSELPRSPVLSVFGESAVGYWSGQLLVTP